MTARRRLPDRRACGIAPHEARDATRKKLADDARLVRAWHRWHREQLEEALAGPHGVITMQVVTFLETMTPASANALLELMRSQSWEHVDANVRLVLLHEINAAVTRMRERMSQAPIDDPLPGQPETAFRMVRKIITNSANGG
jgi:hypothetical protein